MLVISGQRLSLMSINSCYDIFLSLVHEINYFFLNYILVSFYIERGCRRQFFPRWMRQLSFPQALVINRTSRKIDAHDFIPNLIRSTKDEIQMKPFWEKRDEWYPTWNKTREEFSDAMQVDYIRVYDLSY